MAREAELGTSFGGDDPDDAAVRATEVGTDNTAVFPACMPPEPNRTASASGKTPEEPVTDTGDAASPSIARDPTGPVGTMPSPGPMTLVTPQHAHVVPNALDTVARVGCSVAMPPGCTPDLSVAAVAPPPDLPAGAVVNIRDGTILVPIAFPGRRAFHMGTHTVTNSQFLRYIESIRQYPWARQLVERMQGLYYADPDRPVTGVSFAEAAAYAAWAGLALPTPEEWRHAAAGPDHLRYPWGNEWDARRCRWHRGRNGQTTCHVFGYPEGRSPFSLYCCSGNVEEWCISPEARRSTQAPPTQGALVRPPAPAAMVPRPTCGGSWASTRPIALECASQAHRPACVRAEYIGFRLVRPSDDSL